MGFQVRSAWSSERTRNSKRPECLRGQLRGHTWYSKEDDLFIRKLLAGIVVLWNSTSGDIALLLGIGHVTRQSTPLADRHWLPLNQGHRGHSRSSDVNDQRGEQRFISEQSKAIEQHSISETKGKLLTRRPRPLERNRQL